jgi:hypothetical protein
MIIDILSKILKKEKYSVKHITAVNHWYIIWMDSSILNQTDLERSCNVKRRNLSAHEKMRTSSLQQDLRLSKRVILCFNVKSWEFQWPECELWTGIRLVAASADSRAPAISWNLSLADAQSASWQDVPMH